MTTGMDPYRTPEPDDTSADATILETTITASHEMVDIGGGVMAHAEVYRGAIPGPTLRFNVGDTAIVRLVNDLDHPTGIHWHGVELENCADGTEVTQDPAPVGPFPPPHRCRPRAAPISTSSRSRGPASTGITPITTTRRTGCSAASTG